MPRQALSDVQLAETRARIVAEAGRIVLREGYAALSMRSLAKAVGLTAGALYRYFPTKQHVLMGYCADALDALTEQLRRIETEEGEPLRAIERMMVEYGTFALSDPDRFRVVFLDPEVGRIELTDPKTLDGYRVLQAAVDRAQGAGLFRPMAADDIARLLIASVHGIVVMAVTIREIDFSDAGTLVAAAARTMLRGLAVAPDEVGR
ncbi:TetR/AcrR family transcriptional regulator [Methylobacterium sp. ID0610]|uniref:TetR/AcrR family transcriptional regulator n=1 Tax=Methylobacterium carpenticola TaxID=3344827 RepID=UPI0036AABB9D